jgi:F-type H+-transporting ATPase subunit b
MLALFAAAAESAQAAVNASGGAAELLHRFDVQPRYVAMQFVSFAILAGVLYFFGLKPTLKVMDERNAKIKAGLDNAQATAARLAEAQKEAAAQIAAARGEANKIIDDARKLAKETEERIKADATAQASAFLVKANEANELERKRILAEAQKEIARLVVVTTERVLAKQLTDTDRAAYNQAAARELTTV